MKVTEKPSSSYSGAMTPASMELKNERVAATKANTDVVSALVLSVMAGAFIALGATFMLVIKSDASLPFAATQLLGGFSFTLGLFLILAAGAELFTGNCLMVMGALAGRFSWGRLLKSWALVLAGNLVGAVLAACRREADPEKIFEDIKTLKADGLPIGVQMMIGLPGQDRESSLAGLRALAALKGADSWELRLYPCLVIEGTELCRLYERGEYRPLTVEEAALWGGEFIDEALSYGFVPIRIGLQETESLADEVAAGPHHPALGELILAEAEARRLARENPKGPWRAPRREISRFTGHGRFGIKRLAAHAGLPEEEAAGLIEFI